MPRQDEKTVGANLLKNPERFMRNLLGESLAKGPRSTVRRKPGQAGTSSACHNHGGVRLKGEDAASPVRTRQKREKAPPRGRPAWEDGLYKIKPNAAGLGRPGHGNRP